jgi:saccharopine dehydrogenase-like NADP-dependent oxidoreductase
MGFASEEPLDVRGVQVAPLDVISALVPRPVGVFFMESQETVQLPLPYAYALVVEVKGGRSGGDVTYRLTVVLPPSPEERGMIFARLGTVQIYVALPAAVGAKMCVRGVAKGVIAPECLDPMVFLKAMSDMGAPLRFTEDCIKEVVVS